MNNPLIWREEKREVIYTCPVFSVTQRTCRSPMDKLGTYTVLETLDWAIVIPVIEDQKGKQFVMVRQWRHGAQELSLEFPGGVIKKDEESVQAALRELREETGYTTRKITKLGQFNPNPAIMSNQVHFFLAEDLSYTGAQELDEDEHVHVETVAWNDVLNGVGKRPYIHALMGTALALYLQQLGLTSAMQI